MTKAQKVEAYAMLLNGETQQAVAQKFNVSRAYINQIFSESGGRFHVRKLIDGCVYPNLQTAILDKDWNARETFEEIYGCKPEEIYSGNVSYYAKILRHKLQGKVNFAAWEWLRLSEVFDIPLKILMVDSMEKHTLKRVRGVYGERNVENI